MSVRKYKSKLYGDTVGYDGTVKGRRIRKLGFSSREQAETALALKRVEANERAAGVIIEQRAAAVREVVEAQVQARMKVAVAPLQTKIRELEHKQRTADILAATSPSAKPSASFDEEQEARIAQARAELPRVRVWVNEAKELAKREHRGRGDWRAEVRKVYPQLTDREIDLLLNEKPRRIALDYVARTMFGKIGRAHV